jgi:ABC-type phosphate/phosphonate transport system permease subunit
MKAIDITNHVLFIGDPDQLPSVGAGGLGLLLSGQLASFDYRGVAATLIVFIALTFLVELVSAASRRTLR